MVPTPAGFEWSLFRGEGFKLSDFRIGQVLLEVHPHKKRVEEVDPFMNQFEDAGFMLYSMEPVTRLDPGQLELAFIHKDWTPYGWLR